MSCWSRQSGSGLRQVVGIAPRHGGGSRLTAQRPYGTRNVRSRPRPGASVPAGADREDLDPGRSNLGKVFDLTLPLEKAAEGYAAMDDRTAIKVLLQP